uniref:(northern house mosquito) hypothetical protein n=1 Tax=Culex pipiens TaxID=7175 RepID=A0A8D8NFW6_CULPI
MIGSPMIFVSGRTSASGTFSGITSPRSLDIDFLRCSSRLVIDDFLRSSVFVIVAKLVPFEYPEKLVVLAKFFTFPNNPPSPIFPSPFTLLPFDGFKFSTLNAFPKTTGFELSSPNFPPW